MNRPIEAKSTKKILKWEQQTDQMGQTSASFQLQHPHKLQLNASMLREVEEKINIHSIIKQLGTFEIEENSFKANYEKVQKLTQNHLKFILLQPTAISQQGKYLIKNEQFRELWNRILLTNPYVNGKILLMRHKQEKNSNKDIFDEESTIFPNLNYSRKDPLKRPFLSSQ